jgi:hypothetical protein
MVISFCQPASQPIVIVLYFCSTYRFFPSFEWREQSEEEKNEKK